MPKTYTAAGSATAGDVYTASAHNGIVTDVNNLIVPPVCEVVRTTNLTSYTAATDISFSSASIDTDGMFAAGSPTRITIQTTGLYVVTYVAAVSATATMTDVSPIIRKNTSNLAFFMQKAYSSTNGYTAGSVVASLTASDYLTLRIDIVGGSNYTVRGDSSNTDVQTRLSATWIGRTS